MRYTLAVLTLLLASFLSVFPAQSEELAAARALQVTQAWMRALPPGQPTAAAYMTLSNASAAPVSVLAVSSPLAATVEIHESSQVDGMWQMRALPQLQVAAGQSVTLAPGSIHLMMFGLQRSPQPGEQVEFELTLSNGEKLAIAASVRALGSEPAHQHHH